MYVRPPNYRYQHPMRVPENYSGNTFREQERQALQNEPEQESATEKDEDNIQVSSEQAEARPSLLSPPFKLGLGSLFGKNQGIGSEELLILSLILLLVDSGEGSDDLVLFLVLLFFIK